MSSHTLKYSPDDKLAFLQPVVDRAYAASGGDANYQSDLFRAAFTKEVAKLIETNGLAATLRLLVLYEDKIGLPCDPSFLGEQDVHFPNSLDDVNEVVERAVLLWGTSVENYVVTGLDLFSECRIGLTDEISVRIPEWEASEIITRNRGRIDAERQQRDARMQAQGY